MKPLADYLPPAQPAAPAAPPARELSESDRIALAHLARIRAGLGAAASWSGWVHRLDLWHWIDDRGRAACGAWIATTQARLPAPGGDGRAVCWECGRRRLKP